MGGDSRPAPRSLLINMLGPSGVRPEVQPGILSFLSFNDSTVSRPCGGARASWRWHRAVVRAAARRVGFKPVSLCG